MRLDRPCRALVVLAALALPASACDFSDEGGPRFETSGEAGQPPADADDRFAIQSTDDRVKLGLTDEVVYMRLSDSQLREIDEELSEAADQEGLGGRIASAVTGAVSKGLRTRLAFEHRNIRDIRWERGELVVELENGENAFGDMEVDDEDVTDAFAEDDVREFIEEWRRVKDGMGGAGGAS